MVTHSADPFRAVADPTRRAVLDYLRGRPHTVNELADYFDVSRPAISKHLRIMREARVVRERRDGRNRVYEVDAAGLQAIREYFDRFWDDALDAFKQAVEKDAPGPLPRSSRLRWTSREPRPTRSSHRRRQRSKR